MDPSLLADLYWFYHPTVEIQDAEIQELDRLVVLLDQEITARVGITRRFTKQESGCAFPYYRAPDAVE